MIWNWICAADAGNNSSVGLGLRSRKWRGVEKNNIKITEKENVVSCIHFCFIFFSFSLPTYLKPCLPLSFTFQCCFVSPFSSLKILFIYILFISLSLTIRNDPWRWYTRDKVPEQYQIPSRPLSPLQQFAWRINISLFWYRADELQCKRHIKMCHFFSAICTVNGKLRLILQTGLILRICMCSEVKGAKTLVLPFFLIKNVFCFFY